MPEQDIHEEVFTIRSSEVAPNGKVRLSSICDLLQETAGNHALKLNFDISQLNEQKLTWVLHRLHLQMDRLPEWREEICISTWPSSGDTLRAYRDFKIRDEHGNELGRCLSYWLMLNTDTRRPVRMPEEVLDMAPRDIEHVLDIRKNKLVFDGAPKNTKTFKVRRSDLDINRHVNNVKYVEWALEVLPDDVEVSELDIEFRSECRQNDTVRSECLPDATGNQYRHKIIRTGNDTIAALAVSS